MAKLSMTYTEIVLEVKPKIKLQQAITHTLYGGVTLRVN